SDTACLAQANASCIACCQTNHATGIDNLIAYLQACECGTSGACASACSTEFCVNGSITSAGDACDTCLGTSTTAGGACYASIETQCVDDASCNAYLSCADSCPP
ncbi:MAG: hypothetical protein ACRELB_14145, partial [Polyangiaceae bacterium]